MRDGFATVVITSCNRPAYLQETLQSLLASDLTGIARIIVIEDSASPDIAPLVARILGGLPHLFLQNDGNRGQIYAIDRAYAHVETDYVYHAEDDWIFPQGLRLSESRAVLDHHPAISAILGRNLKKYPRKRIMRNKHGPIVCHAGTTAFVKVDMSWSDTWGGFSFNPGLRRMADYHALGRYGQIGPEAQISRHYRTKGMCTAFLLGGQITHIGDVHTIKRDEQEFVRNGRLVNHYDGEP
jgi:hypothetical protein